MIDIDSRTGSKELLEHIHRLNFPARLTTLHAADAAFRGNGPDGYLQIGIERKKLADFINSMRDGRLVGEQLPKLQADYRVIYVVVEGQFEPGYDGSLRVFMHGKWRPYPQPSVNYREVDTFMNALRIRCGVHVLKAIDINETAHNICNLYRDWNKDWADHKSHTAMYAPKFMPTDGTVLLTKPSLLRRVAKELPGVGVDRSKVVEDSFINVVQMVNADEKEWQQIDGIGKTLARRIHRALREITG